MRRIKSVIKIRSKAVSKIRFADDDIFVESEENMEEFIKKKCKTHRNVKNIK